MWSVQSARLVTPNQAMRLSLVTARAVISQFTSVRRTKEPLEKERKQQLFFTACYGVTLPPESDPWLCDRCQVIAATGNKDLEVRCVLCPPTTATDRGGAFKQTEDGGWAHVVCALFNSRVSFANQVTMSPIVTRALTLNKHVRKKRKREKEKETKLDLSIVSVSCARCARSLKAPPFLVQPAIRTVASVFM